MKAVIKNPDQDQNSVDFHVQRLGDFGCQGSFTFLCNCFWTVGYFLEITYVRSTAMEIKENSSLNSEVCLCSPISANIGHCRISVSPTDIDYYRTMEKITGTSELAPSILSAVLRIHEIFVWIRIRGSGSCYFRQ
jgi:hypothetical protein